MALQLIPKELRELKDGIEVQSLNRERCKRGYSYGIFESYDGVTYQSMNIRFDFRQKQCKSIYTLALGLLVLKNAWRGLMVLYVRTLDQFSFSELEVHKLKCT